MDNRALDWRKFSRLFARDEPPAGPLSSALDHAMQKMECFLDLFQLMLCKRCSNQRITGDFCHFPNTPLGRKAAKSWPLYPKVHHKGAFLRLCTGQRVLSYDEITKWNNCLEHGLFHGLMTAFCAYVISPETEFEREVDCYGEINYAEKLLVSCLLHDFARTQGFEGGHDEKLREFFPNLLPEVYEHSNPSSETALIRADRLELQRYTNHAEWSDHRLLEAPGDPQQQEILTVFYSSIRPALMRLLVNEDKIWLRHGIEDFELFNGSSVWPPPKSYQDLNGCGWSIEIGKLPYGFHHCINHGPSSRPWKVFSGLIPFDGSFDIKVSGIRDHYQVQGGARPIKDWLFFYGSPWFYKKPLNRLREEILAQGGLMLKWRVAYNFLKIVAQIKERIIVTNWRTS